MTEWLNELAAWAWARHHNELSWYIRPLFLLPFAYFSYKRSGWGLVATLLALATSMAWFPAPEHPTAGAIEMLAAEREYLLGEWTPAKLAVGLLVPLTFGGLAVALWRRSLPWALVAINGGGLFKIAWTFVVSDTAGALQHLWPAVAGLTVVNVVMVVVWRRRQAGHVVASAHARSSS
ncbi:hypothetical protein OG205_02525 [Lentzea sp. NBC_00516]|uniref:hypothetical protein n=1 Tax=Lentzea sp. NBC_00516 TaxID=2903582 RepID=UPI002E80DCA4|nr:hypothetical protein [Lentzea sp. NBC_00516]WUD25898.1 hypothetical protein OG205_02525 [Lentzea sp. NBC_00516]